MECHSFSGKQIFEKINLILNNLGIQLNVFNNSSTCSSKISSLFSTTKPWWNYNVTKQISFVRCQPLVFKLYSCSLTKSKVQISWPVYISKERTMVRIRFFLKKTTNKIKANGNVIVGNMLVWHIINVVILWGYCIVYIVKNTMSNI